MMRALGLALTCALIGTPACAERIENPIAVFNGLDKITGVTTAFEVPVGQPRRFGGFVVTPKVCYSRPPTEEPKTTTFVEVDELTPGGKTSRIFSGWMFAESPGLNAVEHPVYDVWLTHCRDPNAPPVLVEEAPAAPTPEAEAEAEPED